MKRKRFPAILLAVMFLLLSGPFTVVQANGYTSPEQQIHIATLENRTLSVDKLLYAAFKDIGYQFDTTTISIKQGYTQSDAGEIDGIISLSPYVEENYPHLRKVSIPLDNTIVAAYVREDDPLTITDWDGLAGRTVGILTQRDYIDTRIPETQTAITCDTNHQLLDALLEGKCDVAVLTFRSHENVSLPAGVKYAGKLETLSEYLFLNEKHAALLPLLEDSLNSLFSSGAAEAILQDNPFPETPQTVLHILSSNAEATREVLFKNTLIRSLGDEVSPEWHTVALNVKRYSDDPDHLNHIAGLLRRECLARNISAVVVSGDEAFSFMKDYYTQWFRNVPILAYGISDPGLIPESIAPYVTGIVDNLSAYETVEQALRLFPQTKNLYVINDYSSEGLRYRDTIAKQLAPLDDLLNVDYSPDEPFDRLLETLCDLPDDSLVLFGSYFIDSDGQYYSPIEIAEILRSKCSTPILSIYSTASDYGSIGGKAPDYEVLGKLSADMLTRLLNNESPRSIPMINDPELCNRWVFDREQLNRWGLKTRNLPSGSSIIHEQPSFWLRNPLLSVAFGVLLLAASGFGIWFFIMYKRYRRKQKSLSEADTLLAKDSAIREIKEQLETIINHAPVACTLCVNGVIVYANRYLTERVGMKPGTRLDAYSVPPGRALPETGTEGGVIRFSMTSGESRRFMAYFASVVYGGRETDIMWAVDIEREENERESLQTVLETLPVPVRIVDVETEEVIYANKSCLKLFETDKPADLIGRTVLSLMPACQSDGMESTQLMQTMLRTPEQASMELEYQSVKGNIIDAHLLNCKIDYRGRRASVGIIKDLAAEKEYKRLLLNAAEKEREANQLKSRFLVNMSHEIRTPMNAIIGLTDIELRKTGRSAAQDTYVKINASAHNLLQIINDIIDFSRIEADKVEIFNAEFNLEETLCESALAAALRLEGKEVDFLIDLSLDTPRYIVGDRTRLWQILKNLLDNAAKFTFKGSILLEVYEDENMHFFVRDTGIGIEDEQLTQIFKPYRQVYNEAQLKYTGSGLGMPISKQLCEIMGGTLSIESEPGEGTTVHVSVPFSRSANSETIREMQSSVLADKRILIADASERAKSIMCGLIENSGAVCLQSESAAAILQTDYDSIDMVLLDFGNGSDTFENLRSIRTRYPRAAVLLMATAHQRQSMEQNLPEVDGFLEKPFVPSQFVQCLCAALGYNARPSDEAEAVYTCFTDTQVLLCEDNPLNQEVSAGMLKFFGITPVIAEHGGEAITLLDKGLACDMILMDLQMPVMNGYETTRRIRENPRFVNTPIISLTADAMKEVTDLCLEAGMNDHLAKPINFDSLHHVLLKWLPAHKRVPETIAAPVLAEGKYPPKALSRFMGRSDQYEKALLAFAQDLPDAWPAFEEAAAQADQTRLRVHTLKGMAASLELNEIYQLAADFEQTLKQTTPNRLLYDNLIDACTHRKRELLSLYEKTELGPTETGSRENFTEWLRDLRNALSRYDPSVTAETVELLKTKDWPFVDSDLLAQLYALADGYEFDAALEILEKLL